MSKLAIKAENISKQYRLGEVGTGTLSHDLNRFWHKVRGKQDPYLQIGQANDRSQKNDSNYVWSLKDINFEIEQGDAVGIIGRNGAGKSTLLKLLSKVTKPTTGRFHVNGRIASLLEVGTGFNPEMTGRENIYMNGAILGMRRHEITRKFDEIVAFSGVEAYIDTPVKRYSSGMYVRLAFAVAAHLESEILIVDEVLAVGDAEFQKKCLGKMGDVSKGEGRTVLFVSHNMAAVKSLCNKGILMQNGKIHYIGETENAVQKYLTTGNSLVNYRTNLNVKKEDIDIESIGFKASIHDFETPVSRNHDTEILIEYNKKTNETIHFTLKFKGEDGVYFMTTGSDVETVTNTHGKNIAVMKIPSFFFNVGNFYIDLFVIKNLKEAAYIENDIISFTINPEENTLGSWMGSELGYIRGNFKWIIK